MAMDDPEVIRERFEANRRKFREEQVERAWQQMSGGAAAIPVSDFGAVCFRIDSSMDAAAVQAAVSDIDTDSDGTIDLREFRPWYMARLAAKDADERERREAGFGDEDEWDELEMQRRMRKHMESMEANRIKRTFDTIDADGSGEIEREEFHRLVRRLAPQRSPEWINNQFDLADDGSGSLDFEEFKAWWDSPEIKEFRGEDQREAQARAKLQKLEEAVAQKQAARAQRREQFEEETRAATKLQRVLRGRKGRAKARQARVEWDNRQNTAVTKLQCAVRGRIARRKRSFAAVAIAAKAEVQAKEDISRFFWGDGDDMAEREAQLRRDFQRLQASAGHAVQQYTWEEWRWRWLEMRSGGWLERLEPSIQAEYCRRLAAAAVLADQEAQSQERWNLVARKAAREKVLQSQYQPRSPSIPAPERSLQDQVGHSGATGSSQSSNGITSSSQMALHSPAARPVHPFVPAAGTKRPGVRVRPIPGGTTPVDNGPPMPLLENQDEETSAPSAVEMARPQWYRSSRSPQLLEEHRSLLEESTLPASRMKHRADDLMQGMKLRPRSLDGCLMLPARAEDALAMLQAADELTAPPGSTLRLTGSHRMPFGERPRDFGSLSVSSDDADGSPQGGHTNALGNRNPSRHQRATLSPITSRCLSRTVQLGNATQGRASADIFDDTAASMSDSEYERESQRQRRILSPRPVTADSFLREETPKGLQDGLQWARAADFVLDGTLANSLKQSLTTSLSTGTPTKPAVETTKSGRRPKSVGHLDGEQRAQLGSDKPTSVPQPTTVGVGPSSGSDSGSKQTTNSVSHRSPTSRRRQKQRPIRGLTRWQHGQSMGRSVVVGAGRSVVYDISF